MNINPQKVYIIRNPDAGLIKIGISQDVEKRLNDLQNQCGQKLEIMFTSSGFGGAYTLEKQLHEKFDEFRTFGEWFKFPGEFDIEMIGNKKVFFKAHE